MKHYHLQAMQQAGICIPSFVVVDFDEVIQNQEVLQEDLKRFVAEKHPDLNVWSTLLKKHLLDCYKAKPIDVLYQKVAVRSSCNVEDGKSDSFAGVFESFLNVDPNDIETFIIQCLQSLYSVKALEYMMLKEIDVRNVKMHVIIQTMIDAEYSGICFSSNPIGILNEAVITVAKGLGDDVVLDRVETTSYYYNLYDQVYYYDGFEDLLEKDMILKIIHEIKRIQEALKLKYVDVEFCFKENQLYILQARPITSISDETIYILDNSNIVESYPGISLPLTDSFARLIYTGVFKGVSKRVLKDDKLSEKFNDVYSNMVSSMNGRMYYQIHNWYKLLQFLPMSHKIIPVWQEMLGVKSKDYPLKDLQLPWISKAKTYFHFLYELFKTPKAMKKLDTTFQTIYQSFQKQNLEKLSLAELKVLFDDIKEQLLEYWDITLLNDMYAFIFTGLLKRRLKKKYPDQYNEKVVSFISGISQIESLKPIQSLVKLAILKHEQHVDFFSHYQEYLALYGDRCIEELKLESVTFKVNPKLLDEKIEDYCKDMDKLYALEKQLARQEVSKPKGMFVKRALLGIENREKSRLNRTRIFGMVRAICLSFAQKLQALNIIEKKEDIFYLSLQEMFDLITNQEDKKHIIQQRKDMYERYKQLPSYSRLILTDLHVSKTFKSIHSHVVSKEVDYLYGQANYAKDVEGCVVVVEPGKEVDVKDKIIVARMTDPGWVFLLTQCKGIIVEKGSLLSHTAIISRELKIPAIVAVEGVMEVLKDGDYVALDSKNGIVKIMARS